MSHDSPKNGPPPWTVKLMMTGLFVIWSNAFTAIKHLREIFGSMELVLARFLPVLVICVIWLMSRRPIRKETFATIREAPLKLAGSQEWRTPT